MSALEGVDEPMRALSPTRVFISYSRHDGAFADALRTALIARGYDAWIDREDIAVAEDWRARLGALILKADVVVFVITDASLASKVCAWEVERTRELQKRLVPLAHGPRSQAPPAGLAELNWLFTDHPGGGREAPSIISEESLARLCAAIDRDIRWVRAHAELVLRSQDWLSANRAGELLLAPSLVEAARATLGAPPNAIEIADGLRDYVEASFRAARKARADTVARFAAEDLQRRRPSDAIERIGAFERSETDDVFAWSEDLVGIASRALTKVGVPYDAFKRASHMDLRLAVFDAPGIVATSFGSSIEFYDAADFKLLEAATFDRPIAGLSVDDASMNMVLTFADGAVFLWNALTMSAGPHIVRKPTQTQVAKFAAGGRAVVTFEIMAHGRVWDVDTGRELAHARAGFTSFIEDVLYDEAAGRMVTLSQAGALRQWQVGSAEEIEEGPNVGETEIDLWHRDAEVVRGRFDPTGRFLFVEGSRPEAGGLLPRSLYAVTATPQRHTLKRLRHLDPEREDARPIAFSTDGEFFAFQQPNLSVEIYRNRDGSFIGRAPSGVIYDQIALSENASLLVALGREGAVDVWRRVGASFTPVSLGAAVNAQERRRFCRQVLAPADGGVTSLALIDDRLLAATRAGNVAATRIGVAGEILSAAVSAAATCIAPSPGGDAVLVCFANGRAGVVNLGDAHWRFSESFDHLTLWCGAWSGDGQRIVLGGGSGVLHLVDASAGSTLQRLGLRAGAVLSLARLRSGEMVIGCADGSLIGVGDKNGALRELWRCQIADCALISVCADQSGDVCAIGADDGRLIVWDLANQHARMVCDIARHAITDVDVSSDGALIAVATRGGEVGVCSAADGRRLFWSEESDRPVWAVKFVDGGDTIAAGFEDGTIRTFDVSHTRLLSAEYRRGFQAATRPAAAEDDDSRAKAPATRDLPKFYGGWALRRKAQNTSPVAPMPARQPSVQSADETPAPQKRHKAPPRPKRKRGTWLAALFGLALFGAATLAAWWFGLDGLR